MPLPPDIDQRIQKAKANGFTDAQIQADIRRKYGMDYGGSSQPKPEPAPKQSLIERAARGAGRFLGNEKFGEGLGIAAYNLSGDKRKLDDSLAGLSDVTARAVQRAQSLPEGDPRRAALLHIAQENYGRISGTSKEQADQGPSNREFAAGAANTAINIIGAGTIAGRAPTGATLRTGKLAVSVARQPLKAAVAQSSGMAGGLAGSSTLGQGGTPGEAGRNALVAGGTAGILTGGIGLAAKALSKLTTSGAKGIYGTSARLEERIDPEYAIQRNITGGRQAIERKLTPEFAKVEGVIKASPNAQKQIDLTKLLDDPQFKKLAEQASLGGESRAVAQTARKLFPQLFDEGKIPADVQKLLDTAEPGTPVWEALTKASREFGKTNADDQAFNEAFKGYVHQTTKPDTTMKVTDAIAKRRAIQKFTPQGVLRGLPSASAEAETKDALRGALNRQIYETAPDIREPMRQDQVLIAIQNAMEKMGNRPRTLPGSGPGFIQKTLLTPAIGTRAARELYRLGRPGRFLDQKVITEALRRAIRAGVISGASTGVSQ